MLGDKLCAVTALSVPVHQVPALARTLIEASLDRALSLCVPPLTGSAGLCLTRSAESSNEEEKETVMIAQPLGQNSIPLVRDNRHI